MQPTSSTRKQTDAVEAVRELTGGGVHYSFEAIGLKVTTEQAFRMLRKGGTATIIGMIPVGTMVELHGAEFLMEKKTAGLATWVRTASASTCRASSTSTCNGKLHLDDMISRRIKLKDVNDALNALKKGEVARSVIMFN